MASDENFVNEDYSYSRPFEDEVYGSSFLNCDFSGSDLTGVAFQDCRFEGCNFSLANITNTRFQSNVFIRNKLIGLDFGKCNDFAFAASFKDCNLDHASFHRMFLKQTKFNGSSLVGADFREADISKADFSGCELKDAMFEQTNMEAANFRTAMNYLIDVDTNRIKKAKFSLSGLPGLLVKFGIDIK